MSQTDEAGYGPGGSMNPIGVKVTPRLPATAEVVRRTASTATPSRTRDFFMVEPPFAGIARQLIS